MNKDILYEILKSESESLSLQDIRDIMDEELQKSPDEMDTDLVDLCLNAIENANNEKLNKKPVKIRITKILVAAVIFILVIAITVPVGAKYFNINVPNGIVRFYDGCFNIDISNKEYVEDIFTQLQQDGIEDAVLPRVVLYPDTKVYNYQFSVDSLTTGFDFESPNISGRIIIQSFVNCEIPPMSQNKLDDNFERIQTISTNEINIIVFQNEKHTCINYITNNNEYSIFLNNCNFNTALEIAKTI